MKTARVKIDGCDDVLCPRCGGAHLRVSEITSCRDSVTLLRISFICYVCFHSSELVFEGRNSCTSVEFRFDENERVPEDEF